MAKGMTRPRKKGSKQPKPYWRRVNDGDAERWVHPKTFVKLAATFAAGVGGGLLGYFILPNLLTNITSWFVLDFLKDYKNDIVNIFKDTGHG